MRRLGQNLLLALAATLLAWSFGEFALWASGRFEPEPRTYPGEFENKSHEHFIADEDLGWRMRPGVTMHWTIAGTQASYHADAAGFRASRPGEELPSGRRMALVGDSFFWGFGIPWASTCGAVLQERLGDTSVLNRSQPGFGVDQIAQTLRHQVLPESPELAVVGLFLDDFNRSFYAYREAEGYNKPTFWLEKGRLRPREREDSPGTFLRFLEVRSRFYSLFRRADRRLGRRWGRGEWWSLNEALLERMIRDGEEAGIPLLFVHIPPREPISFPALGHFFEERGAAFLEPDWPKEREELYFPEDAHLNARGHDELATALEAWIIDWRRRGGDSVP